MIEVIHMILISNIICCLILIVRSPMICFSFFICIFCSLSTFYSRQNLSFGDIEIHRLNTICVQLIYKYIGFINRLSTLMWIYVYIIYYYAHFIPKKRRLCLDVLL